MIVTYLMMFLFVFESKSKANWFYENDDFLFGIHSRTFTKIFEATTLRRKLNNDFPNTKIL